MANETRTNSTIYITMYESSYQSIGFGLVDVSVNMLILFVLVLNRQLLKKFAFIFGFALGDTISGLSLTINAFIRIERIKNNTVSNLVHPLLCMPTTQLQIFGNQFQAAMFILIGIERSVAVGFFTWYHKNWTDKKSWFGNLCVMFFAIVSLTVAYIIASTQLVESKTTFECSVWAVNGLPYTMYHLGLGSFSGLMAFVPTLACLIVFYIRKKQMEKHDTVYTTAFKHSVTRNLKMTKLLLTLACLDLCLVALPNLLQILFIFGFISIQALTFWFSQLPCLRGALNLFIYIFINDEFRAALFKIFKFKNANYVSAIHQNVRMDSRM